MEKQIKEFNKSYLFSMDSVNDFYNILKEFLLNKNKKYIRYPHDFRPGIITHDELDCFNSLSEHIKEITINNLKPIFLGSKYGKKFENYQTEFGYIEYDGVIEGIWIKKIIKE